MNTEITKVAEMIKGIRFAMLTTLEPDGTLHSRPMTAQEVEFDGDLWFFTSVHSPKVWEASAHREVSVSFADPGKSKFVALSGKAHVIRDRAKMEELWKPAYKIFFPKGLEDPEIGLLKVTVERAEYWDSAPTAIGRAFDFAKAYVTKNPGALGDHAKVDVR